MLTYFIVVSVEVTYSEKHYRVVNFVYMFFFTYIFMLKEVEQGQSSPDRKKSRHAPPLIGVLMKVPKAVSGIAVVRKLPPLIS